MATNSIALFLTVTEFIVQTWTDKHKNQSERYLMRESRALLKASLSLLPVFVVNVLIIDGHPGPLLRTFPHLVLPPLLQRLIVPLTFIPILPAQTRDPILQRALTNGDGYLEVHRRRVSEIGEQRIGRIVRVEAGSELGESLRAGNNHPVGERSTSGKDGAEAHSWVDEGVCRKLKVLVSEIPVWRK